MGDPVASIVIPTRDRPGFVHRAVSSALAQSVRDVEVIVVDSGTVEPFELVENDERVRVVRADSPAGACAARNLGMKLARGRLITFLDDDDLLLPRMIETSLSAEHGSSLPPPVSVLSGMEEVDVAGAVQGVRLPVTLPKGRHYFLEEDVTQGSFLAHNALVAPLEVLRSIGGWDENLPAWEHDDLFLRLNQVSSLQGVAHITYRKTIHDDPQLSTNVLALAEGMRATWRKHRELFALHPRREAHYLAALGLYYLRAGKWGAAIAATTRSLLRDPFRPRNLLYWAASLSGPRVLRLYRRMRRAGSSAEVSSVTAVGAPISRRRKRG